MADDVDEKDDDDWSEAMAEDPNDQETSKNNSIHEVSSAEIAEPELPVESNAHISQSIPKVDATIEHEISFQVTNSAGEKVDDNDNKKPVTPNIRRQPRSECRARSRDTRQCQKHFQEMIGKHEIRNEELEQREGDLRQRLEALECSMPAVMVWNIWRMAQGAPTSAVRRLMEKQFRGYGADDIAIPTTASQHWDDRVRKIEAERKEALRRAEEARTLLAEKEAAVQERRKRLEEAKKCNQERKEKMEKLAREAAELREALKNARGDDKSCETGECGEIRCKEKWLAGVGSVSSIGSTDLECFAKLQELAEAEICMKRQITELERREEAYMRTLQQADEMWSKMEGDTADTMSELQDQLDLKTAANQQLADRICQLEDELESLKKRLISCKDALTEFTSKEYTEAEIGSDDGEATVKDRAVVAAVKTATASITAAPKTLDQENLAHPETMDQESSVVAPQYSDAGLTAIPKTFDKSSEAIPVSDQIHRGVEAIPVSDQIHRGVEPIPVPDQIHRGVDPVPGLVIDAGIGDEEDIPERWKNWNWDEGCPPDIICDGLVECSTGTDDVLAKGVPTTESKVQAIPEMVEQPVGGHGAEDMANFASDVHILRTDAAEQTNDSTTITEVTTITMAAAETVSESDQILLSREELRNWYNIVDSLHHVIAKCDNCSSKTDDTGQLAEKMKLHLRIKGVAGVKGSIIMEKILSEPLIASEEHRPGSLTSPTGDTQQKITPAVSIDHVDLPDETESYIHEDIEKIDSSEDVNPEFAEGVKFPVGRAETDDISASPIPTDAESKPPEIFDKIADAAESQTDLTEEKPADVDEKKSVSIEELPHLEEKSKNEDADFLADIEIIEEPAEIPHEDSLTEVSIESLKKLENMLTAPEDLEVEAGESRQLSEKLSLTESLFTPAENFSEFDLVTSALADETVASVDLDEEPTHISEDDTSIEMPKESPEEAEEMISVSKEDKLEFEDSTDPSEPLLEFFPEQDGIKHVSETLLMPTENEELKLDDAAEKDVTIDEPPPSFVTLRTPPPSKTDVESEIKDGIPSTADLKDELQSVLDIIPRIPSSEIILDKELEALPSLEDDVPDDTEQMPELGAEIPDLEKLEELETDKVSITTIVEDEEQPTIINAEGSLQLGAVISEAQEDDVKEDSKTNPTISEAQSYPDVNEIERPADKLAEDIPSEGKIIVVPARADVGKPYLAIAKVESSEKLKLPKPGNPCICKPRTCPLLGRSAGLGPKLKVLRVGTEGTQTTPPIPETLQRKMDKPKLKTISEGTWPSPEVGTWRRATIWPRRPRDKSTLTTVCVDTQTDSALVRERIALEGITRKDDCTCSGACPRKTQHGGCIQRISNRPPGEKRPAPVSHAVGELLGSAKFPTTLASRMVKEIAAVRYTGRSLVPENSELDCIECGRPMTPEGTPLSTKCTLPTSSKSQKNITASLKNMTSCISRETHKKDNFTCCECKTSGKMKTVGGSKCKRQNNKDKRSGDRDPCCPCPSEVTKKASSKSSKKKQKPETKDQAIMAKPKSTVKVISRSTVKESKGIDVNENKSSSYTAPEVKLNDTDIKIVSKVLSTDEVSYCECEESSNEEGDSAINKIPKGFDACDCLLRETVSKGSSCTCTEATN